METLLKGIRYFTSSNPETTPLVKSRSPLEYDSPRNPGLSDTGYYLDLSQSIGNRPVYKTYTNYVNPNTNVNSNYKNGDFSCKQPYWHERCY